RIGFRIAVVVAVRHPVEVAASLRARDGVPVELANTLWIKYNGLAEQRSREVPRVFVEYPSLLKDWKRQVDRIAGALEIDLSSTDDKRIEGFLSSDLRRQRATIESVGPDNTTPIEQLYAMLSMASGDFALFRSQVDSLVAAHMQSSEARKA